MPIHLQIILFAFAIGLAMGSFGNVLIYRLPLGKSVVFPGSGCPVCDTPIRWYDNLPVLSYLILRGRCRSCGEGISWRYPGVEALTGLLFAGVVYRYGVGPMTVPMLLFVWALVVITFIDFDHRIIPDVISIPGTIVGLAVSFLPGLPDPVDALIGSLAGAGFLFLILYAYEKIMGDEGMGMGDVKLMAMIGAFLGWQALPVTIMVSSLTGSLTGVGFALVKGEPVRKFPVPFGPFLALGALVHLFYGVEILLWYLGKMS